jgi:hypothetical protein
MVTPKSFAKLIDDPTEPAIKASVEIYLAWNDTLITDEDERQTIDHFRKYSKVVFMEPSTQVERLFLLRLDTGEEGGPAVLYVYTFNGEIRFVSYTFDLTTTVLLQDGSPIC